MSQRSLRSPRRADASRRPRLSEKEFQAQIVDFATLNSWRVLHVRPSIGRGGQWMTTTNLAGWPDLTLMRLPNELLFREVKVPGGVVSPAQEEMLAFLGQFPFASAGVWWPSDWDLITQTLAKPRRRP